jgi:predicted nucleic-acid-binding protein
MIGIDSNILVRLVVKDHPKQFETAQKFEQSLTVDQPGYISLVVLVEYCWTLRRLYKQPATIILELVEQLLNAENIVVERESVVVFAVWISKTKGVEFSDCLIAAIHRENGCSHTVTFDQTFAQSSQAELLK